MSRWLLRSAGQGARHRDIVPLSVMLQPSPSYGSLRQANRSTIGRSATVQGAVLPDIAADLGQRYREVSSSGIVRGIGRPTPRGLRAFGEKVFEILRRRRTDCVRPMASVRYEPAASPLPGPSKGQSGKSWCSCAATGRPGTGSPHLQTFGPDAVQVITKNPYRLAHDIRGIGFKTTSAIAINSASRRPPWSGSGTESYPLTKAMDEGHSGLPTEELMPLAEKLLEVPQELIPAALDLERHEGTSSPTRFANAVYSRRLASGGAHHRRAADALANGKLPWPWIDPDRALPWVEGLRSCPCRKPGRRDPARTDVQGVGHDRWPRRWKNNHR